MSVYINSMRYILFTLLLLNFSCQKEYSCEKCMGIDFTNATIIFTGEQALDGCGWLIKIGPDAYHPDLLDSTYLQGNLPVKIVFEVLPDKFFCGLGPKEYPVIHVISIMK